MASLQILILFVLTVLKVRDDQVKTRLEEEQQNQVLPAQQPVQLTNTEVPQPQPVSFIPPQPNQHNQQMCAQPASQNLPSSNYNTTQSNHMTGMAQAIPFVPQSTGQVQVHGQSMATIESEEPESDQHKQLQHTGGGLYQRRFMVKYTYSQISAFRV